MNALAGPKGEKITYTKLESCCPFPTKRSEMGVGLLDVYEIKWEGQKNPVILYLNIYEKGYLMVPDRIEPEKKIKPNLNRKPQFLTIFALSKITL